MSDDPRDVPSSPAPVEGTKSNNDELVATAPSTPVLAEKTKSTSDELADVAPPVVEVAPPVVEVAPPSAAAAPSPVEVAPPNAAAAPSPVEVAPPSVVAPPVVEVAPPSVVEPSAPLAGLSSPALSGTDPKSRRTGIKTSLLRLKGRLTRRNVGLGFAAVAMLTLLGVEIWYIAGEAIRNPRGLAGSASSSAVSDEGPAPSATPASESPPGPIATADTGMIPPATSTDEALDEEPEPKPEKPRVYKTVEEASIGSCSTGSVDGLSRQIIEQVRCINPNALVPLPSRPNLSLDSHIFPYLEAAARRQFVKALDANPKQTLRVHSLYRTVAQQYLVRRWAAGKRCGVPMATPPGESNHETGRALDIAEAGRWRPALESQGFRWLGAADHVHFDYVASGAGTRGLDVLAFQRLWNRNHRDDAIAESGRYDPSTEQRLKKSPPAGFPLGPSCGKPARKPDKPEKPTGN
ncbi:MAG: M15 family metallopeptidase [Polyangiaceae bacterium]